MRIHAIYFKRILMYHYSIFVKHTFHTFMTCAILLGILFLYGTMFWSFSSVLIERWKSQKSWIMLWRSECPKCKKQLWFTELFPIFSYIFQWWKCRGCHTKIPVFYPILELAMWLIFVIMGYAGYQMGYMIDDPRMYILLILWWITWVYIFYDIRYTEIPDQIMIPGIYFILLLFVVWYYNNSFLLLKDTNLTFHTYINDRILWAFSLYTFFYLQILIPWIYFLIKKSDIKNIGLLLLSFFTFPIVTTLEFFRKKWTDTSEIEIPTWIWWWDLRIAIFIGLTLWISHWILSFFIAYLLWSIIWIYLIISAKIQKTQIKNEIPFWPFLWIGWIICVLYYKEISDLIYIIL